MSEQLEIYDELRKMHAILKDVGLKYNGILHDNPQLENAIDAVDSVLYLAEGEFSRCA